MFLMFESWSDGETVIAIMVLIILVLMIVPYVRR
jgi:hypothetical protein